MRKKKQQPKVTQSRFKDFADLAPEKKRRLVIKGVGALAVLGVSAGALSAYDKKQRTLHDLSVIGQGQPVIVQIHDPACPTCRQLKSRSSTALKGRDNIHYRLADVTTSEGRELQQKYGVETITLLLFDGEGKRVSTIRGLQNVEYLQTAFNQAFSS
jgi:thioredoxin-related protein